MAAQAQLRPDTRPVGRVFCGNRGCVVVDRDGFRFAGAWLVIPFAGIELLALGVAFLVHARHAGDYERIVVRADRLIVERVSGGNLAQMECQGPWIRVEYGGARRELIRLVAAGREMSVGRFVPDDGRSQLARELRASVAGWRG
jgi:uncharacterized membrane protein